MNLLCYWLAPTIRSKNIISLCFSLIFYAWAGPKYVLLLAGMTLVDWFFCLRMDRSGCTHQRRKAYLAGAVAADLVLLCIFKYLTFLLGNTNSWFGWPDAVPQITLPVGISFYTFQLISYVADVYRREVPAQTSYWKLLLYVSMFHQCIAGPIVRYQDVEDQLDWRRVSRLDLSEGAGRFVVGLAKKAMLANPCGALADTFLCSASLNTGEALSLLSSRSVLSLWLGVLAYTMQIYLDFSAYSDMAIGMGRMIGFHYRENFDYPYLSRSVTEFWRRWHMSLSYFFRDYVYIPLGGSYCSRLCNLRNLTVVWLLTGLWHGADWNFLLWGAYYLVFLLFEKFVLGRRMERIPGLFRRVYLLLVVALGWLIFRVTDLSCLWTAFQGLFGGNRNPLTDYVTNLELKNHIFFLLVAVIGCTPLLRTLYRRTDRAIDGMPVLQKPWIVLQCLGMVLLLLLSTAALVGDQYNPFLYYRF